MRQGRFFVASCSLAHSHELVFNSRGVVRKIDRGNRGELTRFNLSPFVDLKAEMLLYHIGMHVANRDLGALFDDFKLIIVCHQVATSRLISDHAFSYTRQRIAIIASAFPYDAH